jgi:hypothetical protein
MTTIVLNSLNYVGVGIQNAVSWFRETSAGIASQFSLLTNRINFGPTKTTVAWKLTIPVVIAPAEGCCSTTVYDDTIVDITVRYARDIPAANRTDTKVRIQNLVASAPWVDSVVSLTQAS